MSDQRPDPGDPTASSNPVPAASDAEETEAIPGQGAPVDVEADADGGPSLIDDELASDAPSVSPDDGAPGEPDGEPSTDAPDDLGDAAVAGAAGPAWTTTPVAPDPEATEAALAALAARPEVTLEPPEGPPPLPLAAAPEPPEEGTPVLLVGGILVGAFIVALALVILLFRPFDSGSPEVTPSPSPVATEVPSASPSAEAIIDVPNFQGLSLEDAELTADDYGLVLRVTSVESDEDEPGTVLSQDPPPGEAMPVGSTIDLEVAAAPGSVAVPDVIDLPEEDALAALDDAGLVAGDRSEAASDTIEAGNVLATDPAAAAELARGSEVAYVVSSGPAPVAVPDVIDLPEEDALAALDDAGLVAGDRSEAASDTIEAGNVLATDPAAAAELARGSEVAYVVSSGPAPVAVPDVIDLPEEDALAALDDAGLVAGDRSEAASDTIEAGNVLATDPAAAAELARGSEVAYVVSSGPAPVAVPDVIDLPEEDALAALDDAGLVAGDRSEAASDTIEAGNVLATDPAAAAELARGSEVAYVVSSGPAPVAVPDVIDLPEEDALAALDDAGLVAGDRSEAASDTIEAGNVLATDPAAAAELARGSEVAYVVSSGPAPVAVPDVIDLPEEDALAALDDAGLVAGDRSEAASDTIEAGNVLATDPAAAAELARGSEVAYVVSSGPAPVAVPDVIDLPEEDALAALDDAGLVAGDRSEAASDTIEAGNVLATDPAAAAELARGSEVAYVVSSGPAPVAVPDVIDLPEEDALAALDDAGLVAGDRSEAASDTIEAGNVLATDPAAAAELARGSEVAYVVSSGPAPVAVPDVIDLPEEDALAALDDAGLVAGDRSEAASDTIEAGNVLATDPAAAAELARGSEVAYVVSSGPAPVAVPDVIDLPEEDALAALDDAGLVAGDRSEAASDTIEAGNVLATDPAAAAELARGSEVAYVVSSGPAPVAVPDVIDLPEEDALAALDDAGLVAGDRSEAASDTIEAGNVLATDPAAAAELARGSEVAYVVSSGPAPVAVPDVIDLPEEDALAALDDAGLVAGDRSEAASDTIEAGNVLATDPAAAAELARGSEVAYVVSSGPAPVAVPDVIDLPEEDALAALDDAGLVAGDRSEAASDTIEAGNVLATDPAAAAELARGSEVAYVVSSGPAPVAVPDVIDLPEEDALAALDDAGLVAGDRSEAASDTIEAGNVLATDPAAAAELARGSEVAYVVSSGPAPVAVPDVIDLPEEDALAALDDAGLVAGDRSEAASDTIEAGNVLATDPAAAAELARGSEVAYVVSSGPAPVAVPDVIDLPEEDALAALDDAGLVAGDRSEAASDTIEAGNVLATDPAAAAELARGSEVAYVVSSGPAPVAVPDVIDLPEEDALAALDDAGLVAGDRSEAASDTIEAGNVLATDPAAAAELARGSEVAYVVSSGPAPVAVPDVIDLPEEDALAALDDAGLVAGDRSEAASDTIEAGNVLATDPAAAAELARGSEVAYVVSSGPAPVAVPAFEGMLLDDAQAAADALDLVLSTTEVETGEFDPDTVLGQEPAPGALVDRGSTVALDIAVPLPRVDVPDIGGMTAEEADDALTELGLVGSAADEYSTDVPAGLVVRQAPAPRTPMDIGSTVSYVVSLGIEQVEVPDLTAAPADEAPAALEAAGLQGDRSEAYSDAVPAGQVISQDPAAGDSADIGSTVSYVVSLGIEQVEVPDLTAAPADEAPAALEAAGLQGDRSEAYSDAVPAGQVISQDPAAGDSADIGSTVSYVVSLGIEQVEVPDLTAAPADEAPAALEAAGLQGDRSEAYSDAVPAGQVISQDPAAGDSADIGSTVSYVVSLGIEQVEVPDLTAAPADEAPAALEAAGLQGDRSEAYSDAVPAGQVISQDPAAGDSADIGSTVSYVVSLGVTPLITVPDVRDLPEADAGQALEDAGLVVGETVEQAHEKVAAGDAIKTDPSAGAEVDLGSALVLYISTGSAISTVPDVKGLPEADAVAALTDAGLVVASTEQKTNASVPAGEAVKTTPPADSEVDAGSSVVLTISRGPKQVEVPDIVGLSQADAVAALEGVDLVVGEGTRVEDASPRDTVLDQDPAAGTSVDARTAVDVTLSSGPTSITVPDVKGLPEADAVAALTDAGLVVASTEQKTNASVPAGEAVKTTPPADSEVDAGSSVVLTISRGPKQVEVPDIVGLSQADAVAALEGVDLVVGEGTRVEDASPRDTVLDQDPAAGTSVDARTAVDVTLSSGPTSITVPDVKGLPEADAVAALTDAGLVVASTEQKTNASVPAGEAVKTTPPADSEVDAGSSVVLTISRGPKQVEVPDIVGLSQADAVAALEAAEVTAGDRSEANDDAVAAGGVVAQDPEAGAAVDKGTPIDYVVSLGPTAEPHGAGGSLESPAVIGQLDAVAAAIPTVRELEVGQMPYDAISAKDQRSQLASRSEDLHDPATLDAEEAALKRMGFLGQGDDLAKLLRQLYGQALPVAYSGGSMDVLQSLDALDGAAEADAARELGRSATDQAFGLDAVRGVDPAEGDEALAGVALDEGDGTATMLQWAAVGGADPAAVDDTIVPGDDGTLASMPQVLQREYTLPFLEGRLFVDRLRDAGGWGAVDDAWSSPPESTEQILHPKLYPGERPTSIDLGDLGGTLGDGWSEAWQQTMGEARIAVWLADGQPGTQEGPKAPIKLPKANAAAGWGGDRLVSLDGPGGSWAVVWQTKWDGSEDVGQFAQAAKAAIADLPGAHAVLEADITAGLSNPVLVILTSDADTLAAVGSALGVSP